MTQAILRDISGALASPTLDLWEPVVITGEQISAEAERLASLDRPANGRREAMILHPRAAALGNGLVPGIRVVLSVLKPGEETVPNSAQFNASELLHQRLGFRAYRRHGGSLREV